MPPKTIDAASLRSRFERPAQEKGPADLKCPERRESVKVEVSDVTFLILPMPPSVNALYATVNGRRVKSANGRAFCREVEQIAHGLGITPFPRAVTVGVRLRVYRAQKSGDLSNRVKALEDALQGICFENDDQIVYQELFRGDDKVNPRVEVEIWEMKL